MRKILKNITWEMDKNGNITLVSGSNNNRLLHVWIGNIKSNVTLKTLAKKALKGGNIMLMVTDKGRKTESGEMSYVLGPIVDAYNHLVWQGVIVEPKAYVV